LIAVVTFLPALMISLSVGACFVYAYFGDYNGAAYWFAAAALNAVVTFKPF